MVVIRRAKVMTNEIKVFLKDGTVVIYENGALLLGKKFATVECNENAKGIFKAEVMYDLEKVDAISVIPHKDK